MASLFSHLTSLSSFTRCRGRPNQNFASSSFIHRWRCLGRPRPDSWRPSMRPSRPPRLPPRLISPSPCPMGGGNGGSRLDFSTVESRV
eukprot:9469549-Pyramimonas_sp.AAC.2